jgi:hypothetical protein
MISARIEGLYRYPVKGMTPESLASVALRPGATLPLDRAYAIERRPGKLDAANPRHLPKINFVMLMRDEALAAIRARLGPDDSTLTLSAPDGRSTTASLASTEGRDAVARFIEAVVPHLPREGVQIVSAAGHSFCDVAAKCVHIVNLASVRALERVVGRAVDPLRFRPNIVIDGPEAWSELGWLDRRLTIGGATAEVFARTERCDATNVDPVTAARDMSLPMLLQRTLGHRDFGIYARITSAGDARPGDTLTLV